MKKGFLSVYKNEPSLIVSVSLLLLVSLLMLGSLAPHLFPGYFIYILLAIIAFFVFSQIDFDSLSLFSWHFYFLSLFLLIMTFLIGQTSRGVVRWIPIGDLTFQPTEFIRPFLIIFFANFFHKINFNIKNIALSFFLVAIPIGLIVKQPSLGVAVLTLIGIAGVFLAQDFNKKNLLILFLLGVLFSPLGWFILQDYQKERVLGLFTSADPFGEGYNRIQSIIAVGSGQISGRGLGEGVQTQLAFLPERHTDFMFASIAEEFGFLGTLIILLILFFIIFRLTKLVENARSAVARGFISGVLFSFFAQVFVHAAMNMGIAPITGLPLPLVSAGGSSLIATMITLGIVLRAKKDPEIKFR